MKKTVIYEFPDDFKFPEYFGQKNTARIEETRLETTGELFSRREIPKSTCQDCPFCSSDDYGMWCRITGGQEEHKAKCPFYDGAEVVNYDEY